MPHCIELTHPRRNNEGDDGALPTYDTDVFYFKAALYNELGAGIHG